MSGSFSPLSNEQLVLTPNEVANDHPLQSFKLSAHTTGVIHGYTDGVRKGTIQVEPLYALTKLTCIGIVSIPQVSRLDLLNKAKHRHDTEATLEIPENFQERLTFAIELGFSPQEPQSFGVGLNYELYSVVVRVVPNPNFPAEISEHFVSEMGNSGLQNQVDIASAELAFFQRIHGRTALVFREDSGEAYIMMAPAPMVRPPKLTIEFKRPDLRIEIIPFSESKKPTHKVRFYICDRGGRNKTEDLRQYITSIQLDAER
ncbi:MAG TPA: hypothetical protein VE111_13275 [Bradyrhizobium sp.]|nr:hypothetical protein [Bradyrhizobium sp.]